MTPTRDELLERYADAAAQDPRRPSDRVRNAARAHAQMLRDQAATAYRLESAKPAKPSANQPQWTLSLGASLAVVGLAGLLYVQIDRGTPEVREAALGTAAPSPAPPVAAAPIASPPAAVPPTKPAAAVARKDMRSSPPVAAVQDRAQASTQAAANGLTARADAAPPAETNTAPKVAAQAANPRADASPMCDTKSEARTEPAGRVAPAPMPAAAVAPAAPSPVAAPAAKTDSA